MLYWVRDGLRLFMQNVPLLSAVVLTVWLPANLLLEFLDQFVWEEAEFGKSIRASLLCSAIVDPFVVAATVFALMRRKEGRNVSFWECIAAGFRNWAGLLAANLVAGLQILLGLLVVIPGVQFWIRYSLLAYVVVLEGRGGKDARQRSWDLTKGRSWAIVGVSMGITILWFVAAIIASFPVDWLWEAELINENSYFALTVLTSCLADILFVALTAVLFAAYWDLSGRDNLAMTVDGVEEEPTAAWTSVADDGNPYRAPRT